VDLVRNGRSRFTVSQETRPQTGKDMEANMPRLPRRASGAILGTMLALAVPTGFALAANDHAKHGVEVSGIAKTNIAGTPGHGAAVSVVAKTNAGSHGAPTVPTTPAAKPAAHPANHGADVSAVAKDNKATGGSHGNHGGAVAPVAHKP
jgi:hypothetical protein